MTYGLNARTYAKEFTDRGLVVVVWRDGHATVHKER